MAQWFIFWCSTNPRTDIHPLSWKSQKGNESKNILSKLGFKIFLHEVDSQRIYNNDESIAMLLLLIPHKSKSEKSTKQFPSLWYLAQKQDGKVLALLLKWQRQVLRRIEQNWVLSKLWHQVQKWNTSTFCNRTRVVYKLTSKDFSFPKLLYTSIKLWTYH